MLAPSATDLQDTGLYLQGLLQILAIDNHLHERQKEVIREFALAHGFERGYVDDSINNVLKNRHIPKKPPRFHSKETALDFLINAAKIAVCDGILHPKEKKWILDAAEHNEINNESAIDLIWEILNSVPEAL